MTPFSFVNKGVSFANKDFGQLTSQFKGTVLRDSAKKKAKRINIDVQNSLTFVGFCLIKDLQKLTIVSIKSVTRCYLSKS